MINPDRIMTDYREAYDDAHGYRPLVTQDGDRFTVTGPLGTRFRMSAKGLIAATRGLRQMVKANG